MWGKKLKKGFYYKRKKFSQVKKETFQGGLGKDSYHRLDDNFIVTGEKQEKTRKQEKGTRKR